MIEWLRTNIPYKNGERLIDSGCLYLIIDVTRVPNYDQKGSYLLMVHPLTEVTKNSSES